MNVSPSEIEQAARVVWDYHRLNQPPQPADVILVMGSHDLRVAARGADLYLQGLAPWIVMSGGLGRLTSGSFAKPEAELFAEVARTRGVPDRALLLESRSTNTGENILFTRRLLEARGIEVRSVLAVQKPYMERRALATFGKQWPAVEARVTSPELDFDEYCSEGLSKAEVIDILVGDLQRILEYPKRGYLVAQEVPPEVLEAFHRLVAAGHTRHLLD